MELSLRIIKQYQKVKESLQNLISNVENTNDELEELMNIVEEESEAK